MIVPVGDQALEQVRAAQEGRIVGRRTAKHEMVAAAGAGMATVDHELLGGQASQVRRVIEMRRLLDQLVPALRRMDIDFDDARVGRHAEMRQARVGRRLVAFHDHRQVHFLSGRLDGSNDFQVIVELLGRRHEDVELAVARLGAHGKACDPGGRLLEAGTGVARLFPGAALAMHFGKGGGGTAASILHLRPARCTCRIDALAQLGVRRQRIGRHFGVRYIDVGVIALRRPRLRVDRQAIAHGRIAREQVAALGAQEPRPGLPLIGKILHDRQRVADGVLQPLGEHLHQAFALHFVVDARIEGIDIARQAAFAPHVVIDVLESREDMLGGNAQALGNAAQEMAGLLGSHAVIDTFVGV